MVDAVVRLNQVSYRSAGPWFPAGMILAALVLFGAYLPSLGGILFAVALLLWGYMLLYAFQYLLMTERLTSEVDQFVLQRLFLGIPLGSPQRARKIDVVSSGLNRISFSRPSQSNRAGATYPGWRLVLQTRSGPSLTTSLPLTDKDADTVIAFVRANA